MLDLLTQIGGCVLYHDYRSGSFRDWSGAGNDGTPTLAGLTRGGADFHAQSQLVTVPYASGLDLGSGAGMSFVVLLPEKFGNNADSFKRIFNQAGGVLAYYDVPEAVFTFSTAGGDASVSGLTSFGSKSIGVSWAAGGIPELYFEGVFYSAFSGSVAAASGVNDIGIGNRTASGRTFGQTMSAICFFNKALSATEHAQVYDALRAMKWPTKATGRGTNRIGVASDCVAGYNMRPVAGKVFDMSGNGNHGTVVKATSSRDGLEFNGVDSYVTIPDDNSLDLTTTMTIAAWVKTTTDGIVAAKWTTSPANRSYAFVVATVLKFWLSSDGTGFEAKIGTIDVINNRWNHIVAVLTGGSVSFYVNGVFDRSQAFSGQTSAFAGTSDLRFGDETSGTIGSMFNGTIKNVQIFNVAKDADWVMSEYQKGARQVTFKTDWGARETTAAVGAPSKLTNTPWEVVSGTHEIITTTINGTPVKAIRCVTAGVVAIPASLFRVGESGAARGGFRWWMYPATGAAQPDMWFTANLKTPDQGYLVRFSASSNRFRLYRDGVSLAYSATDYVSPATWHKVEITVGDGGVFTTYLDGVIVDVSGGSGTNPITDTTYTTSKFLAADLDVGDMLALGSVDGEYALEKQLGVSNER